MNGGPWINKAIKTIPAVLKRGGRIELQGGITLTRAPRGAYLAWVKPAPNPTIKGFRDESELIDFINAHQPWRVLQEA